MIAALKPYPAMKDSGVEWLGEVPEHWEMSRLKGHVANIADQTSGRVAEEIYVALEHVESWTGRIREAGSDVSLDNQVKRFRGEDVLFGKQQPYLAKVTRHFYKPQPMRSLEEIRADILAVKQETEGLLGEIVEERT